MAILSSSDFPALRGSLDTSIEAADLPDATIALPVYLARAELLLLKLDPLASSRTGTDGQHVKLAAIFLTAALIAPAIPQITEFQSGEARTRYMRTIDWNARAAELRSLADDEINAVLFPDNTDTADRPTSFALACSGRSGLPSRRIVGLR